MGAIEPDEGQDGGLLWLGWMPLQPNDEASQLQPQPQVTSSASQLMAVSSFMCPAHTVGVDDTDTIWREINASRRPGQRSLIMLNERFWRSGKQIAAEDLLCLHSSGAWIDILGDRTQVFLRRLSRGSSPLWNQLNITNRALNMASSR